MHVSIHSTNAGNYLTKKLFRRIPLKKRLFCCLVLFLCILVPVGIYFEYSQPSVVQEPQSSFNLPDLPHLFVGRESDINKIEHKLQQKETRVCIISGPPGVGKSAVALKIGHTLQDKKEMQAYYVDMKLIDDIENLEEEIVSQAINKVEHKKKPQKVQDWATQLTRNTLLILDNCDKHTSDERQFIQLHGSVMAWTKGMLKVIITNQAVVVWKVDNVEQLYQHNLDFLAECYTREMIAEGLKHQNRAFENDNMEDLVHVLQGMPLAIENILHLLKTSTSCNIECIISRLKGRNPIQLFGPTGIGHVVHTVEKSIELAYNSLSDEHKECGWHLTNYFGGKNFDEVKIKEMIETEQPDIDLTTCTEALTKVSLLSFSKTAILKFSCRVTNIRLLPDYTIDSNHDQSYQFHPLIRAYFHMKSPEQNHEQHTSANEGAWHYVTDTGLSRNYCPDLSLFLDSVHLTKKNTSQFTNILQLGTIQKDVKEELTSKMTRKDLIFTDRVQAGVLATYWGRLVFPGQLRDTKLIHFINSTLRMFKKVNYTMNYPHLLTAYVFYNHQSLGIQWKTNRQEQHQCFCPNPKTAAIKMIKGERYVEKLYAATSNNHLAWSARRSFYLDAFCCCRAWGECGGQWRYWMRGIVSHTAITRIFFTDDLSSKCEIDTKNPVDTPAFIEGMWHYSFTKQHERAVDVLKNYLKLPNICPVLKVAAIMVIYSIYSERGDDDKGVEMVQRYLTDSNDLIDRNLHDYVTLYQQVVIPFLHEAGKRVLAQEVEQSLSYPVQDNRATTDLSYECNLIYVLHKVEFKRFICLTL